ncbi:hypothetical protein QCA50_002200 [Cerrena zonata]|uniref:AIG1-type G domain-containing protein n=1 Tax=Cerrena zonata TaxID=2478898 RepID=A0AAW0GST6_9APHY
MSDSRNQEKPVLIGVMGGTGTGKSTFVNLASGSNLQVGFNLESCTSETQLSQPFVVDGRTVVLIDTPGFDDTFKTEADVLHSIADFLAAMYQNEQKLSGVIFLHRISDNRIGGLARKNFRLFRSICGDDALKHTIIATTMWGEVSAELGERRESELSTKDQYFKPAFDEGAKLVRHDNTLESAHGIVRQVLEYQPVGLSVQREMVDQHTTLGGTTAGQYLTVHLETVIQGQRDELRNVKAELEALRAKHTKQQESIGEMRAEIQSLRSKLEVYEAQHAKLGREGDRTVPRSDMIPTLLNLASQKVQQEKERYERVLLQQERERQKTEWRQKKQQEEERLRERQELEARQQSENARKDGSMCVVQ